MKKMILMAFFLAGCSLEFLPETEVGESSCKHCLETCRKKPEEIFGLGGSSYDRACLKARCAPKCIVSEQTCRSYLFAYQGPVAPQFAFELCKKMAPYFGSTPE